MWGPGERNSKVCSFNFVNICLVLFFSPKATAFSCVFLRYTQNLKDAKDVGIKKAIASKLSLGAVYFFMNGTYGLAFWYGTSLILSGEPGYTIGTVLAVSLV